MRLANRVLAAVFSLAVIAGAIVLIVEIVAALAGWKPVWVNWNGAYAWTEKTTWDSVVMRIVAISTLAIGLILFILEVKRPRRTRLAVADSPPGIATSYTRRGVATALRTAADRVEGANDVSVQMRRRSVTVAATTISPPGRAADAVREQLTRAAQMRLNDLRLQSPPKLTVRVTPRKR